jgi:hypothetical protein
MTTTSPTSEPAGPIPAADPAVAAALHDLVADGTPTSAGLRLPYPV